MASARGHRTPMQYRTARYHQAPRARGDCQLGIFFIVEINGFAAPIGLPFHICIIQGGDMLLMCRAIAMEVIAIPINAAIDISTLVGKLFVWEQPVDHLF